MSDQRQPLWPYGTKTALFATPLIWLVFALTFAATHASFGWPDKEVSKVLVLLVSAVGFVPLFLSALDYIASRRGTLDIKGVKIDFSQGQIRRVTVELPPNIVQTGVPAADSAPLEISRVLSDALNIEVRIPSLAAANEIVRVDIGDGNGWWVSRLLVLTAGAARIGLTKAIVFVGAKLKADGCFLGWAPPQVILGAVTEDATGRGPTSLTYCAVYERALRMAKLVAAFGDPGPQPPPALWGPWLVPQPLPLDVQNYLRDSNYFSLGEAALEQILMDQVFRCGLENPPDRLTLYRLEQLFAHRHLLTDSVDLELPKEKQIAAFLSSEAPYVALVRNGHYEGLVERAAIERLFIQQLFLQSQQE